MITVAFSTVGMGLASYIICSPAYGASSPIERNKMRRAECSGKQNVKFHPIRIVLRSR
jgi:hypothetical protein